MIPVVSFTCPIFIIFSLYWKATYFYYWKQQKLLLPDPNFSTISPFIPLVLPSLPICHITTSVPILCKGLLGSFMLQEIRLLKSLLPFQKEAAQTSLVLGRPCENWQNRQLVVKKKKKGKQENELCQNFHFPNGLKCLFYANKGFWLFRVQISPSPFNWCRGLDYNRLVSIDWVCSILFLEVCVKGTLAGML